MHLMHNVARFKTTGMMSEEDEVTCNDTRRAGFISTMGWHPFDHDRFSPWSF